MPSGSALGGKPKAGAMPKPETDVQETDVEPVRRQVWHRHGPLACGGVMFVVTRRLAPGDMVMASDVEMPSGRALQPGESLDCDACRSPVDESLLDDLRDAGAYPVSAVRRGTRTRYVYRRPPAAVRLPPLPVSEGGGV